MDRESGRSKGFGFVTYASTEAAAAAISAMDGKVILQISPTCYCGYAMTFMPIVSLIYPLHHFANIVPNFRLRVFASGVACPVVYSLFLFAAFLHDTCHALQLPNCFINAMMQYN